MAKNKKIVGKKSEEKLSHFSCVFCRRWWTVGDAPVKKKPGFVRGAGREINFEK